MKAKSKRKGNFPPLRFPEFKAEWKRKKLGEVAEIVGGGTPDTNIDEYWDGNIQWFTPSEIKSNFVLFGKLCNKNIYFFNIFFADFCESRAFCQLYKFIFIYSNPIRNKFVIYIFINN